MLQVEILDGKLAVDERHYDVAVDGLQRAVDHRNVAVAQKDSINELRKNVTTFLERCDTLEKLLGVPIVLYVVSLIVFFVWKKCKNSL